MSAISEFPTERRRTMLWLTALSRVRHMRQRLGFGIANAQLLFTHHSKTLTWRCGTMPSQLVELKCIVGVYTARKRGGVRKIFKFSNFLFHWTSIIRFRGINRTFFLSINRFERKKQLHSAILAFKQLRLRLGVQRGAAPYLIIGGGYDERVYENVSHFNELNRCVTSPGSIRLS